MSYSDLYIPNDGPIDYPEPVNLQRQSVRMLRCSANEVKERFYGLRTSHSFWGFYQSPNEQLGLLLDDGNIHQVRDSDITVIPPWCPFIHHITNDQGWHQFILCSLPHFPDVLIQRLFKIPFYLSDPTIAHEFKQFMHIENNMPNLIKALHSQSLASKCFLALINECDENQRQLLIDPNKSWLRLEPVLDYIRAHLADNIGVDELANLLGVSSDHFTRLFKRMLNQTPIQYIIQQRVSKAAELLCDSDLNLDQIAIDCGFPNRRYLSRRFSESFGMPPAHFRKHI